MSDIVVISIQDIIKELQGFLSDVFIERIEQIFKQFNNILKTFEDYESTVDSYDILINLVNNLETKFIIHLDEHQTQNTKHDQHPSDQYLENDKLERLIFLLSCLRKLASKVAYLKRIDFMRYILNTSNKEEILFGNVSTEEEINGRYRKLASYLHPDKTRRLYIHIEVKEEYINLCNELVKCVPELRRKLLSDLEGFSTVERQTFHQENAHQFWKKAIDYQNARKAEWNKLKFYNKEDLIEITSEELEKRCIINAEQAYKEYRAACKLADRNKLLKNQIELREYMALSLYVSNRILEAKLYALTAVKLIYQNSNYLTQDDLNKAKGIFDKVNGANPSETENIPQFKTETELVNSSDNSSRDIVKIETLNELSYYKRKATFRSINEYLEKLSVEFILKADNKLVRYQANNRKNLYENVLSITCASTGTYSLLVAAAIVADSVQGLAIFGIVSLPFATAVGAIPFLSGLVLLDKGWKFRKRIWGCNKLDEIIKDALIAYNNGDYERFYEELSKEYKEGSSILRLKGPEDSINHEEIIEELIQHGIKTDFIAYLLILIGEVLITGKIKIPKITPEELKSEGLRAFRGVKSERLLEEAKILDRRFKWVRTKLYSDIWNKFVDLIKDQESISILKGNIGDPEEITFTSQLEEMRNIARINLVICDILNGGTDEIKRAKEDIAEICKSTNSTQFTGKAKIRLEALEDLFWVVSSYELDNSFL